jgi:hypothetical protein
MLACCCFSSRNVARSFLISFKIVFMTLVVLLSASNGVITTSKSLLGGFLQ